MSRKRIVIEFDDSISYDEVDEMIAITDKEPWCYRVYKIACVGCKGDDKESCETKDKTT